MSRNPDYIFDGYDMNGYRFRLSDCDNGPNRTESKALGLTLKVNGRLRRYYDAEGTLVFAYSYDTCMYARILDVAEGYYRDVFNSSKYSVTTAKHQRQIMQEVLGLMPWQFIDGRGAIDWDLIDENGMPSARPFSERARRAMEMVGVYTDCSHAQFATWASEFINRADGAIATYLREYVMGA